jgi:hypothetical protein
MEPWRALNAQSGGVEAQNGAVMVLCGPMVADLHHFDDEHDLGSGPHSS